MATNTYVELKTETLVSSASSVTFDNISQDYTDLVIVSSQYYVSSSGDRSATFQVGNGTVNTTGSNYGWTFLDRYPGTPSSGRSPSQNNGLHSYTSSIATTTPLHTVMHIQNYSNTTTHKTMLNRFGSTAIVGAYVNLWKQTTAINIVTITAGGANFAAGSTFSVYGIKSEGVSPAPKATGGAIYSDSTYYYHAFGATGTFVPSQALTADILTIAGGGSGGLQYAGGGGAGGLVFSSSASLVSGTTYTCTVGAGAPKAVDSNPRDGSNGNNSTFAGSGFSTITATGGGLGGGDFGNNQRNGGNGGSGGGGSATSNGMGSGGTGSQGFNGAAGVNSSGFFGGGGGGSAEAGNTDGLGFGGDGTSTYSSWGLATGVGQFFEGTYYIAGGGGGSTNNTVGPAGGLGGGGTGGGVSGSAPTSGLSNTGSGGGAGWGGANNGGAGGSGVIILRYLKA